MGIIKLKEVEYLRALRNGKSGTYGLLVSKRRGFFKVSFLICGACQLFGHCTFDLLVEELLELGVSHQAGELSRLGQGLLNRLREGLNLRIEASGDGGLLRDFNCRCGVEA